MPAAMRFAASARQARISRPERYRTRWIRTLQNYSRNSPASNEIVLSAYPGILESTHQRPVYRIGRNLQWISIPKPPGLGRKDRSPGSQIEMQTPGGPEGTTLAAQTPAGVMALPGSVGDQP